jgi:hypothetical protein
MYGNEETLDLSSEDPKMFTDDEDLEFAKYSPQKLFLNYPDEKLSDFRQSLSDTLHQTG